MEEKHASEEHDDAQDEDQRHAHAEQQHGEQGDHHSAAAAAAHRRSILRASRRVLAERSETVCLAQNGSRKLAWCHMPTVPSRDSRRASGCPAQ